MNYEKTTQFGINGNQLGMKEQNVKTCFSGKYFVNSNILFCLAAVAISMCLFSVSANAQETGYIVQPNRIDIETSSRQVYTGEIKIHNFDPDIDMKIDIKVIELTQKPNGDWLPFDTDPCNPFDYYPGFDLNRVSSCSDWIKLDKYSAVVKGDNDEVIGVRISTPTRVPRGFYGATIMVSTTTLASTSELVPVVLRTGIPVIANVQVTQHNTAPKVEIQDIGMEFIEANGAVPGNVVLNMKIKNTGVVFPLLMPIIRVRGLIDKHWQLITTHEFREVGIIPGAELNLKSDIGRSLPSGTYQLDAVLYVDQSLQGRGRRFGKEIKFEGDPLMTEAHSDVPLDLTPKEIIIPMEPGQRKSQNIEVHAAVSEKIEVIPILDMPQSFQGKTVGNLKLENELSCHKWIKISPEKMTLENFRSRNFSIRAELPKEALKYPSYYASLKLRVLYADGQEAGTTSVNICLQNANLDSEAEIKNKSIRFQETTENSSEYLLQTIFANNGTSHISPQKVRAAIVKAQGFAFTSAMLNTRETGMLMPYESRAFTGFLDLSGLDPDDYNLEVLLDYPPGKQVKRQVRMKVRDVKGRKVPEILGNAEGDELVEVNWY